MLIPPALCKVICVVFPARISTSVADVVPYIFKEGALFPPNAHAVAPTSLQLNMPAAFDESTCPLTVASASGRVQIVEVDTAPALKPTNLSPLGNAPVAL